jgi:hypothetical protein
MRQSIFFVLFFCIVFANNIDLKCKEVDLYSNFEKKLEVRLHDLLTEIIGRIDDEFLDRAAKAEKGKMAENGKMTDTDWER